jgi:hypothetical protein
VASLSSIGFSVVAFVGVLVAVLRGFCIVESVRRWGGWIYKSSSMASQWPRGGIAPVIGWRSGPMDQLTKIARDLKSKVKN